MRAWYLWPHGWVALWEWPWSSWWCLLRSDSYVHINAKYIVFLLHSGLFVLEALCVHVRDSFCSPSCSVVLSIMLWDHNPAITSGWLSSFISFPPLLFLINTSVWLRRQITERHFPVSCPSCPVDIPFDILGVPRVHSVCQSVIWRSALPVSSLPPDFLPVGIIIMCSSCMKG